MNEEPVERQHHYEVSISGKWAAFFMYLCVNAEKAWETGLAGSSIAKQLCNALGLSYSKRKVVESIAEVTFSRAVLVVDYREINELTKFFYWRRDEIGPTAFGFIGKDGKIAYLSSDSLSPMGECLSQWRENFHGFGELMPEECGGIIVGSESNKQGAS